jgi:lysyl-tRNA synthetase class 2
MGKRIMGKASFAELKDTEGRQIYVSRDDISMMKKKRCTIWFSKLLDIGDFIGVRGTVFKTQVGEISVHLWLDGFGESLETTSCRENGCGRKT